jgi:hypothetical protein
MTKEHELLPVWFFIGLLLAVYGIIVLIAGVWELSNPPAVVLAKYHSGIWGGLLLLLIGGFYTVHFWPSKIRSE